MKRSVIWMGWSIVLLGVGTSLAAEADSGWPREMTVREGTIVIYQPQE